MILLLTLEKHREGVWNVKLVEELQKMLQGDDQQLKICNVEDFVDGCDPANVLQDVTAIINRVSDAADPSLVKRTLAILNAARLLLNIPVFNGPESFALATSKWCHHLLFEKAGLSSPKTVIHATKAMSYDTGSERKIVKPNAGGFGAGIAFVASNTDQRTMETDSFGESTSNDGIHLIQDYIDTSTIYRVWFLRGTVQVAVVRRQNGFDSGCACGANAQMKAWVVPEEVKEELEGLFRFLPDAHAGSVEFLTDPTNGQRLYFDFNLLSTLPADIFERNPYEELATAIAEVLWQEE